MPEGLLPLFPLEVVLLPHAPLPLHIFEERYREMIAECLRDESEFGVVQVQGNGIHRIGCTAMVDRVLKRYDDGRMDIVTFGQRRFEVVDLNDERAFLRAEVRYMEDDSFDTASLEIRREVVNTYLEIVRISGDEPEEIDIDEPELSFRLARISDDLDFRQTILGTFSEVERMRKTAEHFKDLLVRRQTREAMQRVVRQNGHGGHLGDLNSLS